jgi:hypothetical protein
LAGVEQDAGYVHLPEENKEEPAEDAAEQSLSRTPESEIVTHSPIDIPDNVALTVEQAAKIHSDRKEADRAQAELDETRRFARKLTSFVA